MISNDDVTIRKQVMSCLCKESECSRRCKAQSTFQHKSGRFLASTSVCCLKTERLEVGRLRRLYLDSLSKSVELNSSEGSS
jgi:hypothetical protein